MWFLFRLVLLLLLPAVTWGQAIDQGKVGLYVANKAGDDCSQATLELADSQAQILGQILVVPPTDRFGTSCQWAVASDLTIDSPVFFPYSAAPVLKVNSGITLTLDACPVVLSDYSIIDANGTTTGSVLYAQNCDHCTATGPNSWIQCTSAGGDGPGGGSSAVLDLADNGTLESNSIGEIATTEATPSIFTEPSPNKLLINTNQPWPTSSALAANGANCPAGQAAGGVSATGAAEACVSVGGSEAFDTEEELETLLGDVTDVFTNNDGTLADDDLSGDNISGLQNVNDDANAADDQVMVGNGTEFRGVAMGQCNPATEKIHYDPDTNAFSCQTDVSAGTATLTAAFDAGDGFVHGALCGTKEFGVDNDGDDSIELCIDGSGIPRINATCDGAGCDNTQSIAEDRNFIIHDDEAGLDVLTIDPDAASPHAMYTIHDGYQLLGSVQWPAPAMFGDGTDCDTDPTTESISGVPTQGMRCPMTSSEADGFIYGLPITLPGDFDKTADITFSAKAYLITDGGAGTWHGQIAIDCVAEGETPNAFGTQVGLDLTPVVGDVVGDEIHDVAAAVVDTDTTGADCDPGDTLYWRYTSCDTDATPSTGCTSSAGFENDMSIFSVRMNYFKNSLSE